MTANSRPSDYAQRFYLRTARVAVPAATLLADPRLIALAAEDVVWSVGLADWQRREPEGWRLLAKRRWFTEGRAHFNERDRLRLLARECGLRV